MTTKDRIRELEAERDVMKNKALSYESGMLKVRTECDIVEVENNRLRTINKELVEKIKDACEAITDDVATVGREILEIALSHAQEE